MHSHDLAGSPRQGHVATSHSTDTPTLSVPTTAPGKALLCPHQADTALQYSGNCCGDDTKAFPISPCLIGTDPQQVLMGCRVSFSSHIPFSLKCLGGTVPTAAPCLSSPALLGISWSFIWGCSGSRGQSSHHCFPPSFSHGSSVPEPPACTRNVPSACRAPVQARQLPVATLPAQSRALVKGHCCTQSQAAWRANVPPALLQSWHHSPLFWPTRPPTARAQLLLLVLLFPRASPRLSLCRRSHTRRVKLGFLWAELPLSTLALCLHSPK